MKNYFKWLLYASSTFWAIIAVSLLWQGYMDLSRDAFDILDSKMLTADVLHSGDVATVAFNVKRNQDCSVKLSRMVVRTDDPVGYREFVVNEQEVTIQASANPVVTIGAYPLPEGLPPGHYTLQSRYRFYCNMFDMIFPRVRVEGKFNIEVIGHASKHR